MNTFTPPGTRILPVSLHVEGRRGHVPATLLIDAWSQGVSHPSIHGTIVADGLQSVRDHVIHVTFHNGGSVWKPTWITCPLPEQGMAHRCDVSLEFYDHGCLRSCVVTDPTTVRAQIIPLADEMVKARTKFPSNQYLFEALAEEIGEMAGAWLIEGDTPHSRKEALQVACVAMRIYTEGVERLGEDPLTLPTLAILEIQARKFFASIEGRPDLSARSEP